MQPSHDFDAMARELHELGFDSEQGARYDQAFEAAKISVVALMCAKYHVGEAELIESLRHSRNLAAEVNALVARIEESPAFVGYIHSGLRF